MLKALSHFLYVQLFQQNTHTQVILREKLTRNISKYRKQIH
jgi:hypothetical protein